jgi:hypothetical protein
MSLTIRPAHAAACLGTALLATLPMVPRLAPIGAAAPAPLAQAREKEPEAVVPNAEVRFTDGGVMKVKILDPEVPLKTPYGKLVIPIDQVTEIECAWRLSEAVAKRIKSAIARLDSEAGRDRDAASAELEKLQLKAYPALLEAEKSEVAEVRRRAKQLIEKVRTAVSEEELNVRPRDVVHTADSKIAGHIEAESLRARTTQVGEVRVKLSDVRTVRSLSLSPREKPMDAIADPGHLVSYQHQAGKVIAFKVTGVARGYVYGTGTYTLDSALATAAVHSGVLKDGKTGVVKVKILGQVGAFTGSMQNGVQSAGYGAYPGFEILKK